MLLILSSSKLPLLRLHSSTAAQGTRDRLISSLSSLVGGGASAIKLLILLWCLNAYANSGSWALFGAALSLERVGWGLRTLTLLIQERLLGDSEDLRRLSADGYRGRKSVILRWSTTEEWRG